jgi:hypothetical protein
VLGTRHFSVSRWDAAASRVDVAPLILGRVVLGVIRGMESAGSRRWVSVWVMEGFQCFLVYVFGDEWRVVCCWVMYDV